MTPFTQRPLTALSQGRSMTRLARLAGICSVGLACSSANNPGSTGSSVGGGAGNASNNGGSGAGGSAGQSSGGGGTASSPVMPSLESDSTHYDFTWGDFVFEVDPQVGARVTTLSLGGTNIIVPYSASNDDTGATFWTSPQAGWDGNLNTTGDWPPVAEINSDPYAAAVSGGHLTTTGTANATLGASVNKDFSADSSTNLITILYTIVATKAIQAAPWEVTRVPRGGLAFFPLGTSFANNSALTIAQTGGYAWLDDSTQTSIVSSGPKLIADGTGGWLAYALGGNLFIKKFPDVPPASFAPGEGDVEIYPGSGYLELEVQGPYTSLDSGSTLPWTVQWLVVPIPSSVTVAADSSSLTTFVVQQVSM